MRYKYSQNLIEASEMTFAENEYQGIEQNGTMKRIPTTKVKQAINAELSGRLDTLEGTGYTEGSLKTHEDRLDTLEGTGEGSVAKAIGDLAGAGRTTETVKGNADAISGHIEDTENPHEVTKTQVGLGNADNTSDANKPVSTAQQTALNLKEDKSNKVTAFQEEPTNTAYPSEKLVDTRFKVLEGTGYTDETVKGNADAIALRELLSNKKPTLTENSDVYFPTQQAVNEGLNRTMSEIMGFAPRNLMTVFGTATVAETFAELRARAITGDFSTLRLGDYIDLPSLTIGADSVNPTVYPARTINNDYNRLRVEIVGFDDYYYVGNTAYPTQHHVTMMFKDIPTTAPFNETNITTGDYPGSMLFHWLHEQIEPALISAIGLTPRPVDRIIGTVANWAWVGSETIFLPTNVNIFGTTGFSHTNYGTGTQTQFALFALNPNRKIKKRNGSRSYWWLAEPSAGSSPNFCLADNSGNAYTTAASDTYGVVPAFLI